MIRFLTLMSLVVASGLMMTRNAYAYLDPGTGSIIVQGIVAAVAGGLFTIKVYWARLKAFFAAKTNHADPDKTKTK